MAFKTDLEIELQRNCNLARWNDLGKLKKEYVSAYELGWNDFKRMLYDPLRESQKPCTSDEALHIGSVVGQSEQFYCFDSSKDGGHKPKCEAQCDYCRRICPQ